MSKDKFDKLRSMQLVCLECSSIFRECTCTSSNNCTYVFVNRKELDHFFKTGLVPDYKAELMQFEDGPKPAPIPLVWPPSYNFTS